MSKRHNRPDVDSFNGRQHVLSGNRPPTVTTNAPILNVPDGKSLTNKHLGKRPPKLQPVPLMPKTTVDNDNSTLSNTVRKKKLPKLTGMLTVSNSLHAQNLREGKGSTGEAKR
nr:hypothetical protein [Lentzea terrae]